MPLQRGKQPRAQDRAQGPVHSPLHQRRLQVTQPHWKPLSALNCTPASRGPPAQGLSAEPHGQGPSGPPSAAASTHLSRAHVGRGEAERESAASHWQIPASTQAPILTLGRQLRRVKATSRCVQRALGLAWNCLATDNGIEGRASAGAPASPNPISSGTAEEGVHGRDSSPGWALPCSSWRGADPAGCPWGRRGQQHSCQESRAPVGASLQCVCTLQARALWAPMAPYAGTQEDARALPCSMPLPLPPTPWGQPQDQGRSMCPLCSSHARQAAALPRGWARDPSLGCNQAQAPRVGHPVWGQGTLGRGNSLRLCPETPRPSS